MTAGHVERFYRAPVLVICVIAVAILLAGIPGSDCSRLLIDMHGKEHQHSSSSPASAPSLRLEGFEEHRRVILGSEFENTEDDQDAAPARCSFDNLRECAPPAQGNSEFPTFESKREVPNGPNPLHN